MDQETKEYLDDLKERIDKQSEDLDNLKGDIGKLSKDFNKQFKNSAYIGIIHNTSSILIGIGIASLATSRYSSGVESLSELSSFFMYFGIAVIILGLIGLLVGYFLIKND